MRKLFAALTLTLALALALPALGQGSTPPVQVWAEQFNNWSFASQSPNTYTFSGTNCFSTPLVNGNLGQYFVFGPSSAPYPVLIADANPSNSEIVTPTSVSTVAGSCGFAASPSNAHTSFRVSSGTAGLQDAVGTLANSASPIVPTNVLIDKYFYGLVAALPGSKTVAGLIQSLKGSTGVNIIDTTTAPYTFYSWNGTTYSIVGGQSAPPTLAVTGGGAGTGPASTSITGTGQSGIVKFTTGTTPSASTAVFTLTFASLANGGYNYAPTCQYTSIGTNSYTTGTAASVAGPPAVNTFTSSSSALAGSTAYVFYYSCH